MHRTATKIWSTATIKKSHYMSSEFVTLKKKKGLVS